MSAARRHLIAFAVAAACFGGLARADDVAGDTAGEASPAALRVAERAAGILRALDTWQDEDADERKELIATITELPPADRPAIVHALAAVRVSGAPEAHAGVLLEVLHELGQPAVSAALSQLAADDGTRDDRVVLFWFARSQDMGAGLDQVLLAAAACDETELASPAIRSHVRQAIAAEIGRNEPDIHQVAGLLRAAPAAVSVLILEALENRGSSVSTHDLSTLLGADTTTDIALLRQLARLPVREARCFDEATASRLPAYLREENAEVRRLATMTAMRFRPTQCIDRVVELLDDPEAGVRAAAHRSLMARSGLRLLPEHELWQKWLAEERAWLKRARAGLGADLGSEDAATVIRALSVIRGHPLCSGGMEVAVVSATGHDNPEVRAEACATLAALGQSSSITALARCLDDDETRVADAASRALARLTGLKGPTTADEWKRELLD